MTNGDDRDEEEEKEKEDLPPGGEAMQRRRAFLQKRGLPLDEEPKEEATSQEETDATEPAEDGTSDEDDR